MPEANEEKPSGSPPGGQAKRDTFAVARQSLERDPVTGQMRAKEGAKRPKLPPGDQSQLEAMRYVEGNDEDLTQQHKLIRSWLKKDVKGFYSAKSALEKAELGAKPAPAAPTASSSGAVDPKDDDGTDKSIELIEQLLEEAKGAA
jgi:hypothetical protein